MNFDEIIDRVGTHSLKWDGADRLLHRNSEKMWESRDGFTLPPDFLPMWAADMDFSAPPAVLAQLQARTTHGVFGYCIRPESYHEALLAWLARRQRWVCRPEWLLYCPGVLPAINLAIDTFSQVGDAVVIQPPVYYRFAQAIENNHRRVVHNPLLETPSGYAMDFDHLHTLFEAGARLLILCNPHNPTGTSWSAEVLQQLATLCVRYGVVVISDEIHSDLTLPTHQHTPLTCVSEEIAAQTITCLAPSKTFNLAGLRTATLVVSDAEKREALRLKIARFGLDVSNVFGMLAFETAYREGDAWLDALLPYLQQNVDLVGEFVAANPALRWVRPEATHMAWLDFRGLGLTPEVLKERLIFGARIGLSDGKTYFGAEGVGFQRMNIGCPRSYVAEALQRIAQEFSLNV